VKQDYAKADNVLTGGYARVPWLSVTLLIRADEFCIGQHVAMQRSESRAQAAFRALQVKFPNQLNGRQAIIRRDGQLIKISHMAEAVPNDTAEAQPTTAPLFIINPLSGRGIDNLFSTHPSTENRVAALERLAREIGVGGFDGVQPHPSRAASSPWGVTGGGA
jgi:hypothetical protein